MNGLKVEDFFSDPRVRALAAAAARGDSAEVARFVREGVDPNTAGREGMVPLVWAMARRSHAGMRALLAAGANPNVQGPKGLKPLELAAKSSDPELLRILLDANGDPNARSSDGDPLLYTAVMSSRPANVQLLVERGADVNALNQGHTTAVLLAATTSDWRQVMYLLQHGADPMLPDLTGGTVPNEWERAVPSAGTQDRQAYDAVRQLLTARGVRFPAERPREVRRRVFGPDNPIDAGAHEDAPRREAP